MRFPQPLGVDSDILIYLVEDDSPERRKFLVAHGVGRGLPIVVSLLSVGEVLVGRHRSSRADDVRAFIEVLLGTDGLRAVPDSIEIFNVASSIRAEYRASLPDAVHLATALVSGCAAFLTNDAELARRAASVPIPILVLDDLIAADAGGD